MAYNPKKQVKYILKNLKKSLKVPKTKTQKDKYIVSQAKKMDKKPTKPERIFMKIMKELKIKFETQKIVGGKIFDFYVPHTNTLFEVDGDYWHGHDLELNEMNGMQKKASRNDKMKDVIAVGYGYKIERVWEHELEKEYKETKEKIKELFQN